MRNPHADKSDQELLLYLMDECKKMRGRWYFVHAVRELIERFDLAKSFSEIGDAGKVMHQPEPEDYQMAMALRRGN